MVTDKQRATLPATAKKTGDSLPDSWDWRDYGKGFEEEEKCLSCFRVQ